MAQNTTITTTTNEHEFLRAIWDEDIAKVKDLITKGVNIDTTDDEDNTGLILAAQKGNANVVELLCENGTDVTLCNCHGYTALSKAAMNNFLPTVDVLLKAGVPPDQTNDAGETALELAAMRGSLGAVQLLKGAGANPHHVDKNGYTPLMMAEIGFHDEMIDYLRSAPRKPVSLVNLCLFAAYSHNLTTSHIPPSVLVLN